MGLNVSVKTVCYFGTYRKKYTRNRLMIDGLRKNQVQVIECHEPLWHGIEDRVQTAQGGWLKPVFWLRVIRTYFRLIRKYFNTPDHDILMVGYPGHFDILLAKLLSRIKNKPLAWDVLNSLFLISSERGIAKSNPVSTWLIRTVEKWACGMPDMLFLDNPIFIRWFEDTHRINTHRFRVVPIGGFALPAAGMEVIPKEKLAFRVIYYGTYIPNHGVPYILEAARLLADHQDIEFIMIGDGPERLKALELSRQYDLKNTAFHAWLESNELQRQIAEAQLVLGVFGTSIQVTLTNNNKIYEAFALSKPVLSGQSPALPPQLQHGVHLYLCERGSPEAIANAILHLKSDLELLNSLAENGRRLYELHFNPESIGKILHDHLNDLLPGVQT